MELPVGLVCIKCGQVLGMLLDSSTLFPEGPKKIEVICSSCIARLSKKKGIIPDSPENWSRVLEE